MSSLRWRGAAEPSHALSSNTILSSLLPIILVTALALAVYLPFQSASLDDFDSYNFAWAIAKFDPAAGIPHPPGYVLYVWLGRVALAVTHDARIALATLSAMCAALSCGLLFATTSTLFNVQAALYAVGWVLLTPLMWLNANKALSDAPALMVQTLCILLIALAVQGRTPLWAAGLGLGIAAGFRPQGIVGLALALLVATVWLRAPRRAWLATGLAVTFGTQTWLLPLLAAFAWNPEALRTYLTGATTFVTTQESLFATAISAQSILARMQALWFWGSQAVFGPAPEWPRVLLFAATLGVIGIAYTKRRKEIGIWLCIAWLAPQAVVHLLFLNPSLTRYLLAFLFPMAMLVAVGLDSLLSKRIARIVVAAFMIIVGAATLPLAQGLHTIPAPPEQLVTYVATHFPAEHTLITARQSYNALAYYLPDWDVRFADYFGDEALEREIASGQATYVVIADPETLRPRDQYVEIETRRFVRNPQIHAKHARVDVNAYGRMAHLAMSDFALPETRTILIGTPQDAKFVLDGWYRREEIGGIPARWTGSDNVATIRVLLPQREMTLTLRAWSFAPSQTVELLCNDQLVATAPVPQNWTDIPVALPASCLLPDELTFIHIRPSVLSAPSDDGRSTDRRTLGIAISELRFSP